MAETAWVLSVVSSLPQEISLDAQEQWAKETALSNGWTITRTFKGVSSGKMGVRNLLQELLNALRALPKAKRPKWILMIRLDRLGRGSGLESIAAIAELKQLGASLWTREDGEVRLNRASDSILPAFRAIQAALEGEVRSDRAKAGKARRRAAGLHNGNPPYGCVLIDGKPVAYEPEAEITRAIFERRVQGWGYDRLAQYAGSCAVPKLLANGRTRKMRWGRSTIQRLLWCETLRGIAVPENLWDRANAVANPDFKAMRKKSWPYPLAGSLRCTCQMMLAGQASGRAGARERYYVCRRVSEHGYYPHWRASLTEAAFVKLLSKIIAKPGLMIQPKSNSAGLRSRELAIQREMERVEANRQNIWAKADVLTGAQLRERLDEIDAERQRLGLQIESVQREIEASSNRSQKARDLNEILSRLVSNWERADNEGRQGLARAVSALLGGLYLRPTSRIAPQDRRKGQQPPKILTGIALQRAGEPTVGPVPQSL